MKLSPAERDRRSRQAKEQHRAGKLGSRTVAKRAAARSAVVRQERASSIAQRLLAEHAEEVEQALVSVLKRGTPGQQIRAAEALLKAGLRGESVGLAEHKAAHEHKSREELISALADAFTTGPAAGALRRELAERGVVDGTAHEIN